MHVTPRARLVVARLCQKALSRAPHDPVRAGFRLHPRRVSASRHLAKGDAEQEEDQAIQDVRASDSEA